jgi:hypothetical protein
VLENEVLEDAPLLLVDYSFFGHLGDDGEEHARLGPDVGGKAVGHWHVREVVAAKGSGS